MSQKQSKKHHYLPRHYLKGFTNDDGGFYVYDKSHNRIFYSSPNAIFFENDLNTVPLRQGNNSAFLEDLYTDMENYCWPAIDRIRYSHTKTIIKPKDITLLAIFLAHLYWRLPNNIAIAEKWSELAFTDTHPVDYFVLKHKSGGVVPKEMVEAIRASVAFKKSFRIIIAMAPFLRDKNCAGKLRNWRFLYGQVNERFNIVGDAPLIVRNASHDNPATLLDEFVFPVSGHILLVHSNPVLKQGVPGEFIVQQGVAIIQQARRFVVCHNRSYLEALIRLHQELHRAGKAATIAEELFEMLRPE